MLYRNKKIYFTEVFEDYIFKDSGTLHHYD